MDRPDWSSMGDHLDVVVASSTFHFVVHAVEFIVAVVILVVAASAAAGRPLPTDALGRLVMALFLLWTRRRMATRPLAAGGRRASCGVVRAGLCGFGSRALGAGGGGGGEDRPRISEAGTVGQNQVVLRYLSIHFPMSSIVSEQASKRMSAGEHATKASSAERCKRTDERVAQY